MQNKGHLKNPKSSISRPKKCGVKIPKMVLSFMKWALGFFAGQKKLSGSLSMMTRPVKIMQGRIFKLDVLTNIEPI